MCYDVCVECKKTSIGCHAYMTYYCACECENHAYEFVCFSCWKEHNRDEDPAKLTPGRWREWREKSETTEQIQTLTKEEAEELLSG